MFLLARYKNLVVVEDNSSSLIPFEKHIHPVPKVQLLYHNSPFKTWQPLKVKSSNSQTRVFTSSTTATKHLAPRSPKRPSTPTSPCTSMIA